jgi:hypothetical protein
MPVCRALCVRAHPRTHVWVNAQPRWLALRPAWHATGIGGRWGWQAHAGRACSSHACKCMHAVSQAPVTWATPSRSASASACLPAHAARLASSACCRCSNAAAACCCCSSWLYATWLCTGWLCTSATLRPGCCLRGACACWDGGCSGLSTALCRMAAVAALGGGGRHAPPPLLPERPPPPLLRSGSRRAPRPSDSSRSAPLLLPPAEAAAEAGRAMGVDDGRCWRSRDVARRWTCWVAAVLSRGSSEEALGVRPITTCTSTSRQLDSGRRSGLRRAGGGAQPTGQPMMAPEAEAGRAHPWPAALGAQVHGEGPPSRCGGAAAPPDLQPACDG